MLPFPLDPRVQLGMTAIGATVRGGRLACGLSQRELAMLAGMNQSTISRLENGQLRTFRFTRLATVMGVLQDPPLRQRRRRTTW